MSVLVKSIVDLEIEADAVIERARAEAKGIDERARMELASYRDSVQGELDARIAEYDNEARKRHERQMKEAEMQLEETLAALGSIPEGILQEEVDRLLGHLNNL
jgi:vacuolar-type H+-ATPase subunit H